MILSHFLLQVCMYVCQYHNNINMHTHTHTHTHTILQLVSQRCTTAFLTDVKNLIGTYNLERNAHPSIFFGLPLIPQWCQNFNWHIQPQAQCSFFKFFVCSFFKFFVLPQNFDRYVHLIQITKTQLLEWYKECISYMYILTSSIPPTLCSCVQHDRCISGPKITCMNIVEAASAMRRCAVLLLYQWNEY
jgi:hypothetical protein